MNVKRGQLFLVVLHNVLVDSERVIMSAHSPKPLNFVMISAPDRVVTIICATDANAAIVSRSRQRDRNRRTLEYETKSRVQKRAIKT